MIVLGGKCFKLFPIVIEKLKLFPKVFTDDQERQHGHGHSHDVEVGERGEGLLGVQNVCRVHEDVSAETGQSHQERDGNLELYQDVQA